MRTRLALAILLVAPAAAACAASAGEPSSDGVGTVSEELAIGFSTGDSCSIDLPNGTKEPGTRDSQGRCCSVFKSTKCQESDGGITDPAIRYGGYTRLPTSNFLVQ